ncbi:ATP-binding protein, partial [Acinetobacter baumannii]|uniref:sensor histidine kinase n=1 Tax=Acinetobacter baumannii TaxID=470 RepID=UPI0033192F8F
IEVTSRWVNNRLLVSVCDNGRGIAPHNLERIFEPFFTTRDVGKGLGLGLSISYSVIENHGGRLVAESQEGAWTRMSFDLPTGDDHG